MPVTQVSGWEEGRLHVAQAGRMRLKLEVVPEHQVLAEHAEIKSIAGRVGHDSSVHIVHSTGIISPTPSQRGMQWRWSDYTSEEPNCDVPECNMPLPCSGVSRE
jgi:hypothetical protein